MEPTKNALYYCYSGSCIISPIGFLSIGSIFFLAVVFTFGIAILAVSYKVIRAATSNPADSLRYE
jgi:ABC-type lipoprotein release transport system permease subunit